MTLNSVSVALLLTLIATAPVAGQRGSTGFAEDFALALDRSKALDQLIPGTQEYYFHRCLERQHAGDLNEVENILSTWTERLGRSDRVEEIENRQALIRSAADPRKAIEFLRVRLGLRFDHQPETPTGEMKIPTRLDPEALSITTLTKRALEKYPNSVSGFRGAALASLATTELSEPLLASLLNRLRRPDLQNLPALVIRDLDRKGSRGFGSHPIHTRLLLAQLDECARLRPELLRNDTFIVTYLARLAPGPDRNWRNNKTLEAAYLDRLEAFTSRLPSAQNSLKAHVLFHRLAHDLAMGNPDKGRFLAYLRLPKAAAYVNQSILRRRGGDAELVDLARSFPTGFEVIRDDESLVRDYFTHFFAKEESFESYAELVARPYLTRLFAEVKILTGQGDQERWYSLLNDPTYYEALKERVEISFPAGRRQLFRANDPVSLTLDLKNVKTLLVKVHEVNALNFYRDRGVEVDASLEIEGIMARDEKTYTYDDAPLRRVRRTFEFPSLSGPGVFVVDFIGNGMSSRAVIHKGSLHAQERVGSAGHVFRVKDDQGQHLKDASIHLGSQVFSADALGEIVVPFSTRRGKKSIVLVSANQVALSQFEHLEEDYDLNAGAYVSREGLLAGKSAEVILRPDLRLNGQPVSLDLLEDTVLSITATDVHGISSSLEARDVKLRSDAETVQVLRVPEGLMSLEVSLSGRVQSLSRATKVTVASSPAVFRVNRIEATERTAAAYLTDSSSGYLLKVLGKNGEPRAKHVAQVTLTHRDFTDPITETLQTDDEGVIALGRLEGITRVTASYLPEDSNSWDLEPNGRSYPVAIQAPAGEVVRVPYQGDATRASRDLVSMFEVRGSAFVRDCFDQIAIKDGFIEIRDLTPGDYDLLLVEADRSITVRITEGELRDGWIHGRDRWLRAEGRDLLHISSITTNSEELSIQCKNASKTTRVHLFRTHFVPPFSPLERLLVRPGASADSVEIEHPEVHYASGRRIDDEYRYILERRYATKYPGNMLERPGTLLNPFAMEEVNDTLGMGGGSGGAFGGRRGGRANSKAGGGGAPSSPHHAPGTFASFDFLVEAQNGAFNLRPDKDGVVRLPLAALGSGSMVQAVAIDGTQTVVASLSLPAEPLVRKDLRLKNALNTKVAYAQQDRIEFLDAGAETVIEDTSASKIETFDSLSDVFQLYQTLAGGQRLTTFAFLLSWPDLTKEAKCALYSEHACHELHFFLHAKDPEFFAEIVRPYLANKAERTFLDRWLLDENLERYLDPYDFAQLNVLERILLTRRAQQRASGVRHVRELFESLSPDTTRARFLFDTALGGKGLKQDSPFEPPAAAAAPRPSRMSRQADEAKDEVEDSNEEVVEESAPEEEVEEEENAAKDKDRRKVAKVLYRAPDATRRYAEHNYWQRAHDDQGADLIKVNGFWRDFADHGPDGPFVSKRFAEASGNVNEMLMALAVLDLPFKAKEHSFDRDGKRVSVTAASRMLLVRKEIKEAARSETSDSLLVRQTVYPLSGPEQPLKEGESEKVLAEYLIGTAYGCRVVLTNPTASQRTLNLLVQIPAGALPVNSGYETQGVSIAIAPYGTATHSYGFYFPEPGTFAHYPAHVSSGSETLASAVPASLTVVRTPSVIDTNSWAHVSQRGTHTEVMEFLNKANLQRLDLAKIAWRMKDKKFFSEVITALRQRLVYDDTLWSYGLLAGDTRTIREYLEHEDSFVQDCGAFIDTPFLTIDPVEREAYQHLEYSPLFNARAHQFGKQVKIPNVDVARQYEQLLRILAYRPKLNDADWMSVTYYLLLQDRVEPALEAFARVDAQRLPSRLQYDYFRAYLDFFSDDHAIARSIAEQHKDHPVARWRTLFREVLSQLDEAEGLSVVAVDPENRTQRQSELAAKEPILEFDVESQQITVNYRNTTECEIALYEMDVEFLFSSSPFVEKGKGGFAYVRPNHEITVSLPADATSRTVALPEEYRSSNLLIEVRTGGLVKRKTYHANTLLVSMMENYGQLRVTGSKTQKPLSKVYVKVFSRSANGSVQFHKDGYTDLRGRFDYASLSGTRSGNIERYAILVSSDTHGSIIREVAPPTE